MYNYMDFRPSTYVFIRIICIMPCYSNSVCAHFQSYTGLFSHIFTFYVFFFITKEQFFPSGILNVTVLEYNR